jgi:hypothetical protein
MSQEIDLVEYIKKSRQGRRELIEKAEEYVKPPSQMNFLSASSNLTLEFPTFTPKRLMDYKEQVNQNLRIVFHPSKIQETAKLPVLRSISKEENYKKVYLSRIKPHSRRTKSGTYSVNSDKKSTSKKSPKFQLKEQYLFPVLSRYSKK